ncbi:hypothetical protein [Hydrogenophaga soli]
MNLSQKRLQACTDVQSLTTELVATCKPYGAIRYLKVLMASRRGRPQALCFWQMADAEAEQQLMALLHAHRVASYLVLVVALPRPWGEPPRAGRRPAQNREHVLWM